MSIKPIGMMMHSKITPINRFGNYLAYLLQYKNMYKTMVKKEFQGKFKNTALGYFWHLLNPLSQILIYFVIFTVIFGRDIPNYWVYISTGMFAFSVFSTCVNQGCNIIINNSSLVTKMTFAREILIPVKATVAVITLAISYVILAALMAIFGVGPTIYALYLPLIIISLMAFSMGLAYILSAITVYIRDIANAVAIIMSCMMFTVPIFYEKSRFAGTKMETIIQCNPLYHYIDTIHDVFYLGISPNMLSIAICVICAIAFLIIGLYVFKKLEPGFAERL